MKHPPDVHTHKTVSAGRLARSFLLLLVALIPALRDAQADTATVGSNGVNTVDSTDYTDPTYTNLIKNGSNTVSLTGTSTYTGGTAITAGTLQLGAGGMFGSILGDVANASILSFNRGDGYTFAGNISGIGQVQQTGGGTLTLSGNNNYSGGTTITGGALNAGSNTAFGTGFLKVNAGTVDLGGHSLTVGSLDTTSTSGVITNTTGSSTLTTNHATAAIFGGTIQDGGGTLALAKSGLGTLILTGTNSYTGGTTVNNGTLQIGNGNAIGDAGTSGSIAGNVSLTASSSILNFQRDDATAFIGVISGSGQVVQSGTGTLTLSGANSYAGNTTLSGGGLSINHATALGSGTLVITGGGTHLLDNTSGSAITITNNQNWAANFTFTGSNNLTLNASTVAISNNPTVTVAAGKLTVGGIISSGTSSSLTKTGNGELVLTGNSTYTGGTTISGGTLRLGANTAAGSVTGAITNNAHLVFEHSNSPTVSNTISGSGDLTKEGAGDLTLSGNNTYSGGTIVNTGTLILGSTTALGTGGLSINNVANVDLHGRSITVATLSGASGASITNNAAPASTLSVSGNTSSTYSGTIKNGTGTVFLAKSGPGSLTLNGINTYTGGTTLNGGILNFGSTSAIGAGALTIASTSTIDNTSGSALTLTTNNAQFWNANFIFLGSGDGTHDLNLGTGAVSMSNNPNLTVNAGVLTVGGVISGTGVGITKGGFGELTLTGNNTYTGPTIITGGTLSIGNGGNSGSLGGGGGIIVTSQVIFNRSGELNVSNQITGLGSVTKTGSGNLTLSGNNFYTGGTFLQEGTITLGSTTALGTNTGGLNGGLTISAATLDLGGQTVTIGSLDSTIDEARITNSGSAGTLTTDSFSNANFSGTIEDGSGTTALIKKGSGTFILSGSNTFSGGTTLVAGTLGLSSVNALGGGSFTIAGSSAKITNTGANDLVLNSHAQFWNSDFSFTGAKDLNLGIGAVTLNSTRTVTVLSHSLIVGGVISGPAGVGLTKDGSGTLVFTGTNDYSGTTTITEGILQIGQDNALGRLGTGNVVDNASLVFKRSDTALIVSNIISGSGSVTKSGTGIVTLSGSNTYTGGTIVSTGTLQIGHASALGGVKGGVTLSGGTLDLHGFNLTINTLSGASGIITSNTAPGILTVGGSDIGTPFTGSIQNGSGIVSLVKNGTGTLMLNSATNTFTGGTTLIAGTLALGHAAALGNGALTITGGKNPTLANSSGGNLTLANNAQFWNTNFQYNSSDDLTVTGDVLLSTTRIVSVTGPGTFVIDGDISGLKKSGLTLSGGGILLLNGTNTYTGATTITTGLLQIGANAVLGAGKLVNNDRIEIKRSGASTFANVISGKGSLIQNNSGNVTLSGANTYTGGTNILQGTITVGNLKALGTGPVTFQGGTLDLHGLNLTIGNIGSNGSGGAITNTTGTNVTLTIGGKTATVAPLDFSGVIKDGSAITSLVKTGKSTLTLSGTNTYHGSTTLSGGILNINSAGALGNTTSSIFTIAKTAIIGNTSGGEISIANHSNWNANFTFQGPNDLTLAGGITMSKTRIVTVTGTNQLTISGVISGTTTKVGLTKAGPGTLVLTGNNSASYSGATTIKAGTLQLGDGGAINSVGKIANTGILSVNRSNAITISNAISGKGKVQQDGSGTTTLTGVNSYSGGTILNAGTLAVGSLTALGKKSSLTLNAGTLKTGNNIHQINVTGNLNWDSDAVIHLNLTPDATSDFVNVTGSLIALDGDQFTFDFSTSGLTLGSHTSFLVMTVAKGLSAYTTNDFRFIGDPLLLGSTFRIDGKNLWFDDGYGDEPPADSGDAPADFSAFRSFGAPADFGTPEDFGPYDSLGGGPEPVPEPSTWAMLILGGALLIFIKRRRAC